MATQVCSVKYNPGGSNTTKRFFKASNTIYTSDNADLTGIKPETGQNQGTTPLYDTGELMRVGALSRINVYVQLPNNKRGVYRVFCAPSKQANLLLEYNKESAGTLNGKKILGASAGIRRAVYKI